MLPDALIIGTPAGGTSSLSQYLSMHPMYWPARIKEIHYYDRPATWSRGLGWYKRHFPTIIRRSYERNLRRSGFVSGEATPSYLANPMAATRAFAACPSTRIVALLRDPTERAFSYYRFRRRRGRECITSFSEAIETEFRRLTANEIHIHKRDADFGMDYVVNPPYYPYLATGLYANHLRIWLNYYTRDQCLIILSEDFFRDPSTQYARVLEFLDLPPHNLANYPRVNANPPEFMDSSTEERLRRLFRSHNDRLSELIGRDLRWNDRSSI